MTCGMSYNRYTHYAKIRVRTRILKTFANMVSAPRNTRQYKKSAQDMTSKVVYNSNTHRAQIACARAFGKIFVNMDSVPRNIHTYNKSA